MTRKTLLVVAVLLGLLLLGQATVFAQGDPTYVTYVVQSGDTLGKIATQYCTSVQEIYAINRATIGDDPNTIFRGMRLTVPQRCAAGAGTGVPSQPIGVYDRGPRLYANGALHGNVYNIALGDTLYSIGQRFGENINVIAGRNNIDDVNKIYAGRSLIIPGLQAVPNQDTDQDGVLDVSDLCPTMAGTAANNGCPQNFVDSDGDGIPDVSDECPTEFGPFVFNGCPGEDPAQMASDLDGDGLNDDVDECPFQAGPEFLNGCPGEDPATMAGPDSDGDGMTDDVDQCPNTPGPAVFNGCPGEDPATMRGPDSDGDGVPDDVDFCPFEAAPGTTHGCP